MRSSKPNCSLAVEFLLVQETILLQNVRITQLYVIQSEENPYVWFGVLFVDSGIYMGAICRFTMLIDETYPNCPCPRIIFDPIPYHPLVDQTTGLLDTKNAFPDWNSDTHKLHRLLMFVKRVMCQADVYIEQIRNIISQTNLDDEEITIRKSDEAGTEQTRVALDQSRSHANQIDLVQDSQIPRRHTKSIDEIASLFNSFRQTQDIINTFDTNYSEFQRRVDDFKQRCCLEIFQRPSSDGNALIFTSWDHEIHEPIRNCVLSGRFAPASLFASYHKETESVSFVPGSDSPT